MAISAKNTIPSRAVEFETFKRGKGSEINRLLNDNKGMYLQDVNIKCTTSA